MVINADTFAAIIVTTAIGIIGFLASYRRLTRTLKVYGDDTRSLQSESQILKSATIISAVTAFGALIFLMTGCSMPSLRVTLSAETGEATTGDYQQSKKGTTYGNGFATDGITQALSAGLPVVPVPTPSLVQP